MYQNISQKAIKPIKIGCSFYGTTTYQPFSAASDCGVMSRLTANSGCHLRPNLYVALCKFGSLEEARDHLLTVQRLHLYLAHAPMRRAMNSRIVMTRAVQGVGACTVPNYVGMPHGSWTLMIKINPHDTWIHACIHIDHHRSILTMSSKRVLWSSW